MHFFCAGLKNKLFLYKFYIIFKCFYFCGCFVQCLWKKFSLFVLRNFVLPLVPTLFFFRFVILILVVVLSELDRVFCCFTSSLVLLVLLEALYLVWVSLNVLTDFLAKYKIKQFHGQQMWLHHACKICFCVIPSNRVHINDPSSELNSFSHDLPFWERSNKIPI